LEEVPGLAMGLAMGQAMGQGLVRVGLWSQVWLESLRLASVEEQTNV